MRRTCRGTATLALVAGMSGGAAPAASADVTTVRCGKLPSGVREGRDVRCTYVRVPLRYLDPAERRTILVAASVVRADRPQGKRPLVVLSGGPGEPIAAAAASVASPKSKSPLARLHRDRDLVLVDQRGAGASRPALECDAEQEAVTPQLESAQTDAGVRDLLVSAYTGCAQRLRSKNLDLAAFTTDHVARDLDRVRKALKLRRADVFATSYGTKVALAAARRDSEWIGRIVLSSAIPPQSDFVAGAPANYARALRAVNATCAATQCKAKYGDLEAKLEGALASLETSPLTGPSADGKTATLTAAVAAGLVFSSFYDRQRLAALPELIDALGRRDPALLTAATTRPGGLRVSQAQQYAVLCSEELSSATPEGLRAGLAGLPSAARLLGEYQTTVGVPATSICPAFVPRPQPLPKSPRPLGGLSVPVLVVSGLYDQVTPPAYAGFHPQVCEGQREALVAVIPPGDPCLPLRSCDWIAIVSARASASGGVDVAPIVGVEVCIRFGRTRATFDAADGFGRRES